MKPKRTGVIPPGIQLLRYFYGLSAALCGLYLFSLSRYTDVFWFNSRLSQWDRLCLDLILTLVPLLLYLGLLRFKRFFWYTACAYHIFFVLNSALGTISLLWDDFPLKPIIRITGKGFGEISLSADTELILFTVFNLNLLMGIIILWYLWIKRGYFGKGSGKGLNHQDQETLG